MTTRDPAGTSRAENIDSVGRRKSRSVPSLPWSPVAAANAPDAIPIPYPVPPVLEPLRRAAIVLNDPTVNDALLPAATGTTLTQPQVPAANLRPARKVVL